jgi:glycosyltransferase involved in cell wall biosynthesis
VIKVLQVYRTYFPDTQGGGQEAVRQISLNSNCYGIENRIFTPSADPNPRVIDSEEGQIHRVKLNFEIASCGFCFTGIGKFRELVDWADVINYHFPWPFADFMHFIARVNKKTVITYHSDIVRQAKLMRFYAPLMTRFLKAADRIVCTSPNYLESSEHLTGLRDKTEVIPLALNDSSYPELDNTILEKARQQYGEKFFLFVGVLRYYKGLHILLDAIQNAKFKVVIVGSGPIERELKARARELHLDNLVFTGYISDQEKVALFNLCLAVVLPSYLRSEAFGVTLLEGAMYSRALISTEAGTGTSHVNVDAETGIVVAPENPQALRDAMEYLFKHQDIAVERGRNARQRYEKLFSGQQMGQAYADLYARLLNTPDPVTGH